MRKIIFIAAIVFVSCNNSANTAKSTDTTSNAPGIENTGTTDTINRYDGKDRKNNPDTSKMNGSDTGRRQ